MSRLLLRTWASILLGTAMLFPAGMAKAQSQVSKPAVRDQDVSVRYARALLRLAQIELRQAVEANKNRSGTFRKVSVQRLRNNISLAEERLKYVLDAGSELHAIHLRELEGNVAIADLNLKTALRLTDRVPEIVSAVELERLRLTAEVARLAIEKARSPEATKSPHDHLQWQLDQLRQEVLRLQIRVAELGRRG